jgi:hypothetical protein
MPMGQRLGIKRAVSLSADEEMKVKILPQNSSAYGDAEESHQEDDAG